MNKTKVIYIHGAPAVGKLTTAKRFCELTGFKLLHNHLTTDLVRAVFDRGNQKGDMYIVKLRLEILELGVQEKLKGIVLTGAHAHTYIYPNGKTDDWYAQELESITEKNGGEFFGVHLTTSTDTLLERVVSEDRKNWGKISTKEMLKDSITLNDYTKPAQVKNIITIDNTNLSVDETAKKITEFVGVNLYE